MLRAFPRLPASMCLLRPCGGHAMPGTSSILFFLLRLSSSCSPETLVICCALPNGYLLQSCYRGTSTSSWIFTSVKEGPAADTTLISSKKATISKHPTSNHSL